MIKRTSQILVVLIGLAATAAGTAARAPDGELRVPVTTDLAGLAEQARARDLPILVEFAARECGYCKLLEQEHLEPMIRSGDYADRVIIRKILVDGLDTVTYFDGSRVDAADLSFRYGVSVTPTVVLLDPRGAELTDPLVGITNIYFYGAFLDRAIDRALERVQRRTTLGRNARR